jgi:hypothetical protein
MALNPSWRNFNKWPRVERVGGLSKIGGTSGMNFESR